jgi:hypothetical protein
MIESGKSAGGPNPNGTVGVLREGPYCSPREALTFTIVSNGPSLNQTRAAKAIADPQPAISQCKESGDVAGGQRLICWRLEGLEPNSVEAEQAGAGA